MMSQTPSIPSIDNIIELILLDKFVETASQIPREALEFASDESNKEFVIQAILTSLLTNKSETATLERAREIADQLIQYAKIQVEK